MALIEVESKIPVPGFSYQDGFISEAEERKLLDVIGHIELAPFKFQGFEAKRKTKSFGYDYQFDSRKLKAGEPIPSGFDFLVQRVAKHLSVTPTDIAEVLVIEYPPGAVMNWHRDAPPFGIVAGISLLTGCKFKLRPYDKDARTRQSVITIPIARRSIYVLRGESREDWEHSISPVAGVRFSITLRTLRIPG